MEDKHMAIRKSICHAINAFLDFVESLPKYESTSKNTEAERRKQFTYQFQHNA